MKHTCWHIVDAQNMLITFLYYCCRCDLKIALQKICFFIRGFFIMIFYYILFNSKTITFKTSIFSYIKYLNSSIVRASVWNLHIIFLQLSNVFCMIISFFSVVFPPSSFHDILSSLFFLCPCKVNERECNKQTH